MQLGCRVAGTAHGIMALATRRLLAGRSSLRCLRRSMNSSPGGEGEGGQGHCGGRAGQQDYDRRKLHEVPTPFLCLTRLAALSPPSLLHPPARESTCIKLLNHACTDRPDAHAPHSTLLQNAQLDGAPCPLPTTPSDSTYKIC